MKKIYQVIRKDIKFRLFVSADRMQLISQRGTPIQGDPALSTYPISRRPLPTTATLTPSRDTPSRDTPGVQGDLRLTDCSQDFSPVPRVNYVQLVL